LAKGGPKSGGLGAEVPQWGAGGEAPVGLGDELPKKLEHFLNFIYIILMPHDSRRDKNGMNKIVHIFYRLENLEKKSIDCFTHYAICDTSLTR